jgi:hypothetical protein
MTLLTLLSAIIEALRNADAIEEIIAAAIKAGGEFENSPPRQKGIRKPAAMSNWQSDHARVVRLLRYSGRVQRTLTSERRARL